MGRYLPRRSAIPDVFITLLNQPLSDDVKDTLLARAISMYREDLVLVLIKYGATTEGLEEKEEKRKRRKINDA